MKGSFSKDSEAVLETREETSTIEVTYLRFNAQPDHTQLDVVLVDGPGKHCGKPWITVEI